MLIMIKLVEICNEPVPVLSLNSKVLYLELPLGNCKVFMSQQPSFPTSGFFLIHNLKEHQFSRFLISRMIALLSKCTSRYDK